MSNKRTHHPSSGSPQPSSGGPLERLHRELEDLLNPDQSHPYSFITFVKVRVNQYGLRGNLDPYDVINESYKRAVSAIQQGKDIKNFKAWLRKTCLNIIRENKRGIQRHFPVNPQSAVFENFLAAEMPSMLDELEAAVRHAEIQKRLRILKKALAELAALEPDAVQLLEWRLVNGWNWSHIKEILESSGGEHAPSLDALRQRASRAKRKLRKLYHQIEQDLAETRISK